MSENNLEFDPFIEGNLHSAFSKAASEKRVQLLCESVRGMANGLRGISIVVDLANIDRQGFVAGLQQALQENPRNLTASRALTWLYIRESLFKEARQLYSSIESYWSSYDELFLEHVRMLIVDSDYDEAGRIFEKAKPLIKGVRLASYRVQSTRPRNNELQKNGCAEIMRFGAEVFRNALMNLDVAEGSSEQDGNEALWLFAKLASGSTTVALVGNAPNLLGQGKGELIESFDLVVRCNFPLTNGHEQDVGRRTDIVVFNESLRNKLNKIRSPNYIKTPSIGLHPEPAFGLPMSAPPNKNDYVGTLPPSARKFLADVCYSRCTTGLMAINLLIFIFSKKVTLFGFDFFSDLSRAHYFDKQAGAYLGHELQYERWYVTKFLAENFGQHLNTAQL